MSSRDIILRTRKEYSLFFFNQNCLCFSKAIIFFRTQSYTYLFFRLATNGMQYFHE